MTTFRLDVFATAAAAAVVLSNIPVSAAAQQSAILGIVAASGTGRPLENVEVTLDAGGRPAYPTITDWRGGQGASFCKPFVNQQEGTGRD